MNDHPSKKPDIEIGEPALSGRSASIFQGGPVQDDDFSSDDARQAYEEMIDLELRLTPAGG